MNKAILLSGMIAALPLAGAQAVNPTYVELSDLYKIVSNGYHCGNVVLVDVNNDGNLEMLGRGRDLNNGWNPDLFLLSGDGASFSTKTMLDQPDDKNWNRLIVPIDYNNDGNVDFIYGFSYGSYLMKGDGNGNFSVVDGFALEGVIDIDGDDCERQRAGLAGVADFNNDGYPDIISFSGNPRDGQGTPVIFLNDKGTGKFIKKEDTGFKAQRGGAITYGDFNRDGKIDVAVSGWSDDFGNHCIRLYKNNGDSTFEEVASADFDNAKAGTEKGVIRFMDINGDGYLDLFVTGESCPQGWSKQAAVYLNEGGIKFTKKDNDLPGACKSGVDWCDLNGDGRVDFVYAGESDHGTRTIIAYNNGDGTFTADENSIGGHRGAATVTVGDFNNNLVADLMVLGYNDNGPHFQIYNGLQSRGVNTAPTAPKALKMTSNGNATVFSWEAATDKESEAAALRYNIFVKLNNGSIISLVPVDKTTGKLRQGDVDATVFSTEYRLNVPSSDIAEWGVQAIDAGKAAGPLAMYDPLSGIGEISGENAAVSYVNGTIVSTADADVNVYDMAGSKVASFVMTAGETRALELEAGVYVVVAKTADGSNTLKIAVK